MNWPAFFGVLLWVGGVTAWLVPLLWWSRYMIWRDWFLAGMAGWVLWVGLGIALVAGLNS